MTFPGFCERCEQKFSFEKKKRFETVEDYLLQLFRTVCYEKRLLEIEIEHNKAIIHKSIAKSVSKIKPIFDRNGASLVSIHYSGSIEERLTATNKLLELKLKRVNSFYETFTRICTRQIGADIITLQIPERIPLFAGYVGNLTLMINNRRIVSDLIMNIHPTGKHYTECFFIDLNGELSEKDFLQFKPINYLNFIAEMTSHTNNWLTNKTYWKYIDTNTKVELLKLRN